MIPTILLFAKKYWKELLVVAIVGAVVIGVASLYSAYRLSQAKVIELQAVNKQLTINMNICLDTNQEWQSQADSWATAISRMEEQATDTQVKLQEERRKRLAAIAQLSELKAEVSSQITSDVCEEAVMQFIAALGWGSP